VIYGLESDVGAEMGGNACFGTFTYGIERENHLSLPYLEKLLTEICDYHSMYCSIFRKKTKRKMLAFSEVL